MKESLKYDLTSLVDKELRNNATSDEVKYLNSVPVEWRNELLKIKRTIETNMSSNKVSTFELYKQHMVGELTRVEYTTELHELKIKKIKAQRVIQQIENKLVELR